MIAAAGDIACDPSDRRLRRRQRDCDELPAQVHSAAARWQRRCPDARRRGVRRHERLDRLRPTWGAYKSITHPIPGDHEYEDVGINSYATYFGSAAGTGPGYYYSFESSATVAHRRSELQCSRCRAHDCTAETTWLQNDLATQRRQVHAPRLAPPALHRRPPHPGRRGLHDAVLERGLADGADIVLHGNDHSYQRWPKMDATGAARRPACVSSSSGRAVRAIRRWSVQAPRCETTTRSGS